MADTDILGIVSLLVAAGGAAYLLRTRAGGRRVVAVASPPAEVEVEPGESLPVGAPPAEAPPVERAATTVPSSSGEPPITEPPPPVRPPAAAAAVKRLVAGDDEPPPTEDEPPVTKPPTWPPPMPLLLPKAAAVARAARAGSGPTMPSAVSPTNTAPHIKNGPSVRFVDADVPILSVEEDEDLDPTRFGRRDDSKPQPPVHKIVFDEGADAPPVREPGTPLTIVYAIGQTDPGRRRKQNEDCVLLLEDHGVFAVADGMGGHRGGQRASELAVDVVNNAFRDGRFDAEPHPDLPSAASELARAVQMSNAAILAESSRRPELSGMGTTLCAVRFSLDNRRLYVGHVGDSRCYRLRDGVMRQLTTDHTMADHGVRGPEGAQLSRALGMFPTVPIDVILAAPRLGDVYLLCSDGLTKMLADETIATQLQHEEDPRAAVSRLIMFANAHGGKDNISIVLLRVVELGWKPPAS